MIGRRLDFVVQVAYSVYQLPVYREYVVSFRKLAFRRVQNPAQSVVDRQTCFRCFWQMESNLSLTHPWVRAVLVQLKANGANRRVRSVEANRYVQLVVRLKRNRFRDLA